MKWPGFQRNQESQKELVSSCSDSVPLAYIYGEFVPTSKEPLCLFSVRGWDLLEPNEAASALEMESTKQGAGLAGGSLVLSKAKGHITGDTWFILILSPFLEIKPVSQGPEVAGMRFIRLTACSWQERCLQSEAGRSPPPNAGFQWEVGSL